MRTKDFEPCSKCDFLTEQQIENNHMPWRKPSTTMTSPTIPSILTEKGGFIANEKFDSGLKYTESDLLEWTISVPNAEAYELTVLELELDHDCSDSVTFLDRDSRQELLVLRSCDPKINRIKMTKEPVYVTAKEISIVMDIQSERSVRGTGFKMYYEAIFRDENNVFTTPVPDLCKLNSPRVLNICK